MLKQVQHDGYAMDAESFWKKVKMLLSERGENQEWLCEKTGLVLGSLRNKISL